MLLVLVKYNDHSSSLAVLSSLSQCKEKTYYVAGSVGKCLCAWVTSIDVVVLIWSELAQIHVCFKLIDCELWRCRAHGAGDKVDTKQESYVN